MDHPQCQIIAKALISQAIGTAPSAKKDWLVASSYMSDSPDNQITVYDTTPRGDGRLMSGPSIEHPGIQVRVRGRDYLSGWNKIKEIRDYFDTIHNLVVSFGVGDTETIQSISQGGIIHVGRDETENREVFTLNAALTLV